MHLVPEEHNLICSFFPRRSSPSDNCRQPRVAQPTLLTNHPAEPGRPSRYTGATQCMLSLFP